MSSIDYYYFAPRLDKSSVSLFLVDEGVVFEKFKCIKLDAYLENFISYKSISAKIACVEKVDEGFNYIKELINTADYSGVRYDVLIGKKIDYIIFASNDYLYVVTDIGDNQGIHYLNAVSGESRSIPLSGFPCATYEDLVFFNYKDRIVARNMDNVEQWAFPKNERDVIYDRRKYVFDRCLIFLYAPENESSCFLMSLDIETGRKNWEVDMPIFPQKMFLCGSQLCMASGKDMRTFDAKSGNQLVAFEAELNGDTGETALWHDGTYYYVIDERGRQLQAYEPGDLRKLREWQFPAEFRPGISGMPDSYEGKNYLVLHNVSLTYSGVYGGLFTWTPEEVESDVPMECEYSHLKVDVEVFKEGKKEAYRVNLNTQSIHELLRYGEIEIKRVAAKYGKQMWESDERNKKFNGHIELIVDPAIGEDNAPYLDVLMKRCELFGRGVGQQPIKVNWRFG